MKKFLSLFLIASLWTSAFAQGDPAPYVKGQNQTGLGNLSSTIVVPNQQSTKINAYQSRLETGNANVLLDPNFEGATTAWSAYADAAGAAPVDCTGGSPTLTVSNSTTTPLEGNKSLVAVKTAVNSQGNGFSVPFTINASGQGMVQRVNFDYRILSGTYASGDVTFWIYDVTNAKLIQPSASSLINSSITEPKDQLEFQASINSRSYRLCAHVSTVSALAYSLQFDNFSLGRTNKSYGSVVGMETAYTPTIGGMGTGTTSINYATWTRSGNMIKLIGRAALLNGTGSAAITWTLPPGMTVDLTRAIAGGNQFTGPAYYNNGAANNTSNWLAARVATATPDRISFARLGIMTAPDLVGADIGAGSNGVVFFSIDVPVVGLSTSQVMSSDADTRLVSFSGYMNGTVMTANVTNLTLATRKDTHGAWTGSSYVVPVAGDYDVKTLWQASSSSNLNVYVNGALSRFVNAFSTSGVLTSGGVIVENLKAGDVISFRSNSSVTSSSGTDYSFSITKISGPSQIAASESVTALYMGQPTGTLTNAYNIATFPTKRNDSLNAYSGGSYSIRTPGVYDISSQVRLESTTAALTYFVAVFVDGVQYAYSGVTATTTFVHVPFDIKNIPLLAGQVVSIRVLASGGTPTYSTSAEGNWFAIRRVGNY